jgi:hypothetical protein
MTTNNAHPLIGKVLYYDHGEHYTLSEFVAYIGDGYFLARRINPNTGANCQQQHIVSLAELTAKDACDIDIYDTRQAYFDYMKQICAEIDEDGVKQTRMLS